MEIQTLMARQGRVSRLAFFNRVDITYIGNNKNNPQASQTNDSTHSLFRLLGQ